MFQSAPLAEARGDDNLPFDQLILEGFNPLPLPKQGEIDPIVEIEADNFRFQSAPLAEARGDGQERGK